MRPLPLTLLFALLLPQAVNAQPSAQPSVQTTAGCLDGICINAGVETIPASIPWKPVPREQRRSFVDPRYADADNRADAKLFDIDQRYGRPQAFAWDLAALEQRSAEYKVYREAQEKLQKEKENMGADESSAAACGCGDGACWFVEFTSYFYWTAPSNVEAPNREKMEP